MLVFVVHFLNRSWCQALPRGVWHGALHGWPLGGPSPAPTGTLQRELEGECWASGRSRPPAEDSPGGRGEAGTLQEMHWPSSWVPPKRHSSQDLGRQLSCPVPDGLSPDTNPDSAGTQDTGGLSNLTGDTQRATCPPGHAVLEAATRTTLPRQASALCPSAPAALL